jgi:hypothetical protein
MLHRVKICGTVLTFGTEWVRAMSNLESLTYTASHFYICDEDIEKLYEDDESECGCEPGQCDMDCPRFMSFLLSMMEIAVLGNHYRIVGRCCDPESDDFQMGDSRCEGGATIHSLIAAWWWNKMPFDLFAEVHFEADQRGALDIVSPMVLPGF